MSRISENECFLQIAKIISQRSTCRRRQYGSVIVKYFPGIKRGRLISVGYNANPAGLPNCSDITNDCFRIKNKVKHNENYVSSDCKSLHSELNACLHVGMERVDKNCVLYLYGFDLETNKEVINPTPCFHCSGVLRNLDIRKYINNTGEHCLEKNMGIFSGVHE